MDQYVLHGQSVSSVRRFVRLAVQLDPETVYSLNISRMNGYVHWMLVLETDASAEALFKVDTR